MTHLLIFLIAAVYIWTRKTQKERVAAFVGFMIGALYMIFMLAA